MPHRPLKRILLVDDDADLRAVVSLALNALGGYAVKSCASAAEALAAAPSFAPDLILLDIMMPGMDGFASLQALRQTGGGAATPVVLMSGSVRGQDKAQFDALGCLGVIAKPFDPSRLPARLETLWERHARHRIDAHEREFESLRRAYVAELSEKAEALRSSAEALANEGWDRAVVESLYHLAHRLAGSAGLYRLSRLSRTAAALEEILKRLLAEASWPPACAPDGVAMLVEAVRRTARAEIRREQRAEGAAARVDDQSPVTLMPSTSPGRQRTNTSMGRQHTEQSSK